MACVEGLDQSFLKRHHYTVVVIVRVYAELGAQHLDFKAAHIYNEWVQRVFGYSKVAVAIDVYVAVFAVLVEACGVDDGGTSINNKLGIVRQHYAVYLAVGHVHFYKSVVVGVVLCRIVPGGKRRKQWRHDYGGILK